MQGSSALRRARPRGPMARSVIDPWQIPGPLVSPCPLARSFPLASHCPLASPCPPGKGSKAEVRSIGDGVRKALPGPFAPRRRRHQPWAKAADHSLSTAWIGLAWALFCLSSVPDRLPRHLAPLSPCLGHIPTGVRRFSVKSGGLVGFLDFPDNLGSTCVGTRQPIM